jgi:MtrB/PioB family decaheme-associated outer membrane protein
MRTNVERFAVRASVAAVWGALLVFAFAPGAQAADSAESKPAETAADPAEGKPAEAVAVPAESKPAGAAAEDAAVTELTRPTSSAEIGVGDVSRSSAKFGEYNGLNKQGPYGIGNFDLRGGGAYDSNDPTRWRFTGTDLGLETRDLSAEYGYQGRFRLNFGYDELPRNRSDTYQTPYNGAGTSTLTLPSNWIKPVVPQVSGTNTNFRALDPTAGNGSTINAAGVVTPPTAAQLNQLNAIRAADLPDFHNVDLSTKRTRIDGGFKYNFDRQWVFDFSVRHEHKDGAKPMGFLNLSPTGNLSAILPDLIDQDTNQFNVGLNYRGDRSFTQIAYYGSVFKNNVGSMTWENFAAPGTFSTMSSAPSNQFHQLSLTEGYDFSRTTRLVANGSYARNTQNDQFLNNPVDIPLGLPRSSLDGLVISKALNLRLTTKASNDLNITTNYKYDDRENRTPISTYMFYDAGEAKTGASPFNAALGLPAGTLGSNINIYNNRPYSKTLNQFNLDGDYRLTKSQWLKAGWDWQKIDRACPGSWINCADAPETKENTLRAEWRANVEDLSGKIGYAYSQRKVNYDENAWLSLVPMANVVPTGATQSVYSTMVQNGIGGFGFPGPYNPLTGNLQVFYPNNSALQQQFYGSRNDIHELPGMMRFNMADRNRDKLRTSVNWQANEKLSYQAGLDLNRDDYTNSAFGLKGAKNWALNLDGAYTVSEALTANVYFTHEDQRSNSAGASYTAGPLSNTAFVGNAADTSVVGGCFSTVADKNMNAKVDPCLNWTADMHDKVDTLGFGLRHKGLMSNKLDLGGDLIYTRARTDISMTGGTYANNPFALAGAPAPVPGAFFIPAQNLPTVTTTSIELRLNSQYKLDKMSSLRLSYLYGYLKTSDFAYDGMQFGSITTVTPTNEQAPKYAVNVFGVSYVMIF